MGLPESLQQLSGDTGGLEKAGASLGHASTAVSTASGLLSNAGALTTASLSGTRAKKFAMACNAAVTRATAISSELAMAGQAVTSYSTTLKAAKHGIRDHAKKWQHQQEIIDRCSGSEPDKVAAARRSQHHHEHQGELIRSDLRTAARHTTHSLDRMSDALVPGASTMSPGAVLHEVMGTWSKLLPKGVDPHQILTDDKTVFDTYSAVDSIVHTPERAALLAIAVKQYRDLDAAKLLANQVRNLEEAKVAAVVRLSGPGSYAALRQYMSMKEITSLKDAETAAADVAKTSNLAKLTEALSATSKFAKGIAVVGIVSGVVDMVSPPHDGWRGMGDRTAGLLSAAGSAALLLNATPLLALGPVGGAVVAGALLVAGAWAIGNMIADHWDDITHGLSVAKKWFGDRYDDVVKGLDTIKDKTIDGLKDLGGDVKDLAGKSKDLLSDGWHALGGLV